MSINTEKNMEDTILQAATKLFLEKGFASTSTTEIAKEAGCNQALVHYYYRTKDRLFDAIFEKKMKFFMSSLLHISSKDIPFEEKLSKKIETHFDAIMVDPKFPILFFHELNTNAKRLETLRTMLGELPQTVVSQFQNELQAEIDKGNVRQMSIFDLLITIISLNIIVFIGEPIFKMMTKISDEEYLNLIKRRKKENVHIVLKSLKP